MCICLLILSFKQKTAYEMRISDWSSDVCSSDLPDGILNAATVDSLNRLARAVDRQTSAELAIVVVEDFVGDDDFQFALELLNTWGVGKDGADNGLLFLVATDNRA